MGVSHYYSTWEPLINRGYHPISQGPPYPKGNTVGILEPARKSPGAICGTWGTTRSVELMHKSAWKNSTNYSQLM